MTFPSPGVLSSPKISDYGILYILVVVSGLLPLERVNPDNDADLPSMLDENITGTRLGHPATNNKLRSSRPAALKPLNSSDQINHHNGLGHQNSSYKHVNPLSISGKER